jgi:hypothetical protein
MRATVQEEVWPKIVAEEDGGDEAADQEEMRPGRQVVCPWIQENYELISPWYCGMSM